MFYIIVVVQAIHLSPRTFNKFWSSTVQRLHQIKILLFSRNYLTFYFLLPCNFKWHVSQYFNKGNFVQDISFQFESFQFEVLKNAQSKDGSERSIRSF
jgi:hypothetical protein